MMALPALFSFGLSLVACLALLKYAGYLELMDHPGARKLQKAPVPRAGGMAIFLVYILANVFWGTIPISGTGLGAVIVYFGGLYDDRRPKNSVLAKLSFQMTGALLAAVDLYFSNHCGLPFAIICFGFIVLMINSFNLMDNMNGLTAGMSTVLLATFYFLKIIDLAELMILGGALLGFLVLNFPWGKIFLGDQGSQLLGYWMSVQALKALAKGFGEAPTVQTAFFSAVLLIIAFLPFLVDTASVIIIRWRNGKPITTGDQNHLSHQLMKLGFGKQGAPMVLVGVQLCCAFTSYLWATHWQN